MLDSRSCHAGAFEQRDGGRPARFTRSRSSRFPRARARRFLLLLLMRGGGREQREKEVRKSSSLSFARVLLWRSPAPTRTRRPFSCRARVCPRGRLGLGWLPGREGCGAGSATRRQSSRRSVLPRARRTDLVGVILDKGVTPRFPLLGTGLVEEVVELCDLAIACACLHQGVPVYAGTRSVPGQGHSFREKDHLLVDAGCEVADIETLLALDLRAHQFH